MKLLIIFSINRIATPILVYYFVLSILSLYSSLSLSLSLYRGLYASIPRIPYILYGVCPRKR